jgi:GNAT superfamily N-acetyltransferase
MKMKIEIYNGTEQEVYKLIAPYAMNAKILSEFDGYPILTGPDYMWFMAMENNYLIGFASLKTTKKGVKIINAYVLPEYRGKGIHTELIEKRINWCVEKGYTSIEVDCLETSIKQYLNAGFKEIKTFKKWHKMEINL